MTFISIDAAACTRDGLCLEVCPTKFLEADADGLPRQAQDAVCISCGHCVAVCPHGAITNSNVDAHACRPFPKNRPAAESVRALMLSRRSVRVYSDKPVESATLAELLDTAHYAPTAVNTQNVAFAACVDPAKIKHVAGMVVEWLRVSGVYPQMAAAWDAGRDMVLRGAQALAAAHCPTDYAWGESDSVIALSYLELAASSAGLGACWAGLLTRAAQADPAIADFLGVPKANTVRGALMLGYPKYRYQLIPPRHPAKVNWV